MGVLKPTIKYCELLKLIKGITFESVDIFLRFLPDNGLFDTLGEIIDTFRSEIDTMLHLF